MRVLLLVDIQNDFLPGGALAVADGNQVIPVANQLIKSQFFDFVVATQDWHPLDHGSFASNHTNKSIGDVINLAGIQQILWPNHCVQNTTGADFSKDLDISSVHQIFKKGTHRLADSYSGFYDNGHKYSTGMTEYFKSKGIKEVYIMGLATDYCVKFTALDAVAEGFHTYLIEDGCRGVNLKSGDVGKSLKEMRKAGVRVITSKDC